MVAGLPTGRVTLLFTDVEGSTRLLHELEVAYGDVLAEHRRVLRDAFGRHGGVEVDTQGDAFLVAFPSACEAVAAAAEAQAAIEEGPVRVRMGLHTGEPILTSEGYVGLDVHLGARIAASAHGGQIVLSHVTRAALGGGVALLDLGEHRVKDFDEPVWLFQVGEAPFPPLKTISNTNLPRPVSSFVGREREVDELASLVRGGARIVTATGPGGSGKTRLAIEAAAAVVPEFRAGVFWVGFASVRDPGVVRETIARALGAKEELTSHIGERELLLLLDNFEGVVSAAAQLAALVEACPNLHLLVTSQELLRLRGETEYRVLPLAEAEAAALFAERAGVEINDTVRALCRSLDNLPLAVELAAARTSVLSPAQILARLGGRLDLFRGARDADPRQQTLRTAIDWSHELLTADEQRLFAHLAVFAGGCTLDAAEDVAGADLDTLDGLVHKSLVRHSGERFWMLETIRDYALERLAEQAQAGEIRRRHAQHYLALVERAASELDGDEQGRWLDQLEQEYPNIRAALEFPELELRFASALRLFWVKRGFHDEGRRRLDEMLPRATDADPAKPGALFTAALLAVMQGDWENARRLATWSRKLGIEHADPQTVAESALVLGRALLALGDARAARGLFEEAIARGPLAGRPAIVALARLNLGYLQLASGAGDVARRELEAARDEFARLGDGHGHARAIAGLASVAIEDGRSDDARRLVRESLEVSAPLGDKDDIAWALQLAGVSSASLDPERAATLLGAAESLRAALGGRLQGLERAQHERALAALQSVLGAQRLGEAWAAGGRLPVEDAVRIALT